MSEQSVETTVAVEEPTIAPASTKTKPRKSGGKSVGKGKAVAKKTVTPPKVKKSDKLKGTPLRKVQLRILHSLVKSKCDQPTDGMPVSMLAKNAKVSVAMIHFGMGPQHKELHEAHNKKTGYPCLLSRGMVGVYVDPEVGALYYLTPLGMRAYATATHEKPLKFSGPNKNQHAK